MTENKRLKREKLALIQLVEGRDKIYIEITTRAMNNVNAVMAPIVDEANLSEEHAVLMLEWKEALSQKLDELKSKAEERIIAIEEKENAFKSIQYSDAA